MTDAPTTPSPERQPADAGGGLLPCPFCDTTCHVVAWPREFRGRMVAMIECFTDNCYALITADTPSEAVAAWNRRAPAPQAQPDAPTQSAAQTGEVLGPDQHGRVPYAVTAMMEKPGKMGWRTSLVWARSEDEASGMWARIASEQNPDWTVVQPGALAITPEKLAAISQLEPSQ